MERVELGLSEGHGPFAFGREPANPKPRCPAGLAGPRGPHKNRSAQVPFVFTRGLPVRPGGYSPPAKCRAGTDRPAPHSNLNPGPPLLVMLVLTIVKSRLGALSWVLALHDDALSEDERNELPNVTS